MTSYNLTGCASYDNNWDLNIVLTLEPSKFPCQCGGKDDDIISVTLKDVEDVVEGWKQIENNLLDLFIKRKGLQNIEIKWDNPIKFNNEYSECQMVWGKLSVNN